MKFRNAMVAATMLALPLAANAQPITGLYVGGGAGVNIMQSENAKPSFVAPPAAMTSKLGPAVAASVGYGLGNGLRAELEGDYRYNTFSGNTIGGQEQKFGAMVNVLYDFVGLVPYVQPYVGAGVGYQWAQERSLRATYSPFRGNTGGTVRSSKNETEGSWAYQAIVGASVPIVGVPGLALTADYRFMGMNQEREYDVVRTVRGTSTAASVKMENNFNHTILVGVRYNFGQAAPVPVAPPAAEVPASPISRSYLVFFDWDKATLTDRARQIVAEAAANSTKVQFTRIEVNGYTDTSGTPKYNQGLSVRRAQAVAAELVKDGVPRNAISIQGFGETRLLVQTGPGVREPQNRRVEIIIR
jgi:OmpA-OmpF porin, OOP family